jgi:hypothetical protein
VTDFREDSHRPPSILTVEKLQTMQRRNCTVKLIGYSIIYLVIYLNTLDKRLKTASVV